MRARNRNSQRNKKVRKFTPYTAFGKVCMAIWAAVLVFFIIGGLVATHNGWQYRSGVIWAAFFFLYIVPVFPFINYFIGRIDSLVSHQRAATNLMRAFAVIAAIVIAITLIIVIPEEEDFGEGFIRVAEPSSEFLGNTQVTYANVKYFFFLKEFER